MGKGYGVKQFRTDLKAYMQMAAIENQQVVFILEDHQKNLHVAVIMDYTNPSFTVNCQSNPALIKQCNVMWMSKWSKESMCSLPMMVITKSKDSGDAAGVFTQEKKKKKDKRERRVSGGDSLLNGFLSIHQSMPSNAATPRKYMQLMKTYLKVYKHKKQMILDRQQHLKGGVDKLNEATTVVDKLKKEAGEQEVKLNQKQEEANKALKMITNTMNSHKIHADAPAKQHEGHIRSPSRCEKEPPSFLHDGGPEYIAAGGGNAQRAQALFALAWFHAVVQERRTFIPQGWTKFYEFNFADLKAGADILDRLVAMGTLRWDYMHGLMENAIYGGRVDNSFDLRVMVSYLKEFFNGEVISGSSKAHRPLGPNINLPTSADFKEYIRIIKSFSETDKPIYFGLPANIDRSAQRMISANVISQLKVLMRSMQATDKFDRDKWQKELSPVLNLWKKLNSEVNLTKQITRQSAHRMSISSTKEPITSFIQLEHFNALRLVQDVHRSLANVSKVIRGTMLLSPDVKKVADSLMRNETPGAWQAVWEGPEDPFQYLRSLVSRTLACKRWVQKAESGTLLNEPLDLSELFHPDTFLNALRQQTARLHKTAMDGLVFVSSWAKIGVNSKMPVKLTGLQLEGCAFDGARLTESRADSPSVTSVPVCTVAWVPRDDAEAKVPTEVISMPLYMTQEREKVVVCLDVPCAGETGRWIQSGAAMFLKD
ncbi:cytoplasmic dynein 2 heavy chain 1-like [Amphibalanus amphitrite]|uniref:cytoplasmic dynein 2 heavy chain 1-like n=1 Tax=Amphibalanus amphitrite TaxID=1232801 RepID=UPI001C902585|nr:cytoplasmic dynein 2 heavy chain 1-like [Amphibalanus amphitrite]